MWELRTGAMRIMRCYVVPQRLQDVGCQKVLRGRWREAHDVFGLQETTETCATTTDGSRNARRRRRANDRITRTSIRSTHTDMRTRTFPAVGYSQVLRCRRHEKRMRAGCMTSTVRIIVALSVRDRLPIQPQLAEPPPAPGIQLRRRCAAKYA